MKLCVCAGDSQWGDAIILAENYSNNSKTTVSNPQGMAVNSTVSPWDGVCWKETRLLRWRVRLHERAEGLGVARFLHQQACRGGSKPPSVVAMGHNCDPQGQGDKGSKQW